MRTFFKVNFYLVSNVLPTLFPIKILWVHIRSKEKSSLMVFQIVKFLRSLQCRRFFVQCRAEGLPPQDWDQQEDLPDGGGLPHAGRQTGQEQRRHRVSMLDKKLLGNSVPVTPVENWYPDMLDLDLVWIGLDLMPIKIWFRILRKF